MALACVVARPAASRKASLFPNKVNTPAAANPAPGFAAVGAFWILISGSAKSLNAAFQSVIIGTSSSIAPMARSSSVVNLVQSYDISG